MRFGVYSNVDGRYLRGGACLESAVPLQPHEPLTEVVIGLPRNTMPAIPADFVLDTDSDKEGFERLKQL